MPTTYLRRTPGGSGNQRKFTFSFWIKKTRHTAGSSFSLFDCGSSTDYFHIYFPADDKLTIKSKASNSTVMNVVTNRIFRDTNAWFHVVIAVDSEQGTAANRCKVYINGSQVTSFSSEDYGSQNQDYEIQDTGSYHYIGTNYSATSNETFEGQMAYAAFVDGTQEAPSIFGETDSTTGEWKIKTTITPSSGWGANGWFILKDGNSVTDQSGQSNNWTVQAGTLSNDKDNPSNNFCTLNPLDKAPMSNDPLFNKIFDGGLYITLDSNIKNLARGTLGVTSGKWYWEAKVEGKGKGFYGICNRLAFETTSAPHDNSAYSGIFYYEATPDFRYYSGGGTPTTGIASVSNGSILGFALDMDNKALYIHKDGVYMNSGDPTSGASKTGAISGLFSYSTNWTDYEEVFPAYYVSSTSGSGAASFNFGNGYFRTTAVSSAQNPDDGIGVFEYDVPASYRAITTKGLNA